MVCNRYLNNYAPDITIMIDGVTNPDPLAVYAVVELKHASANLNNDAFGQIYDYLTTLSTSQPNRRCHAAILSNLRHNYVVILDSNRLTKYHSVSFMDALRYVKAIILE